MSLIDLFELTIRFELDNESYTKTFFSEESYENCWDQASNFNKSNYDRKAILAHILSKHRTLKSED
jgi:hypothetical protein